MHRCPRTRRGCPACTVETSASQADPIFEEPALLTTSKKSKKKKGKKSDPSTPIVEEAPILPSNEVVDPVKETIVDVPLSEEVLQPVAAPEVDIVAPKESEIRDAVMEDTPTVLAPIETEPPKDFAVADDTSNGTESGPDTKQASKKSKKSDKDSKLEKMDKEDSDELLKEISASFTSEGDT